MPNNPAEQLTSVLKEWENQYQAMRSQLTLQDLHTLRIQVAQIAEMVERDATGPSSSPVNVSDDVT